VERTSPRLVVHLTNGSERVVELRDGRMNVGRAPDAGIRLDLPEVSGHHAELHWDGTQLSMRDLSSTNGTEVNGRRLTEWTVLRDGDRVRWGPVTADVVLSAPAPAPASGSAWSWGQTAVMSAPPPDPPRQPAPPVPAQSVAAQSVPAQSVPAPREPAGGRRSSAKRIFISHASEDKRRARMIAGILRRQGWEPWIDESSILGGASWAASIQQALKASSVVVLLITANSVAKEWVLDEIVAARNLRVPIVPAVLEEVRLPDELRFMLQRTQFVDISAFTSTGSDDQHKRNHAAQRLDNALLGVLERQGRLNPDRARMRIGHVLEWLGVLLVLGGFAGFVVMGLRQSNPEASPVPVFIPWGVFIVGMIIGASGAAMVRSGRAKGL
jgi:TIR domain/FHA domain